MESKLLAVGVLFAGTLRSDVGWSHSIYIKSKRHSTVERLMDTFSTIRGLGLGGKPGAFSRQRQFHLCTYKSHSQSHIS